MAQWSLAQACFDKDGTLSSGPEELLEKVKAGTLTDVVVFAHGWNNSADHARALYEQWLGLAQAQLPGDSTAAVGIIGVFWPAMLWPDEAAGAQPAGEGAAGLPDRQSPGTPVRALTSVYDQPDQQALLDQLATLLDEQPRDPHQLATFHDLFARLGRSEPAVPAASEDAGPEQMLGEDPKALAERFAAALDQVGTGGHDPDDQGGAASLMHRPARLPAVDDGGAAGGLDDLGQRLWQGAKEALRQLTYYQMKARAGRIGQAGLAPLLTELFAAKPDLRIHLLGHSFGARLVSFALAGLDGETKVASVTLLEGAFSHSAFASPLPLDATRSGALAGRQDRVAGPLLVCYSRFDSAVGTFYPLASAAAGEDAADLAAQQLRWGAMGHDGAQGVPAQPLALAAGKRSYQVPANGVVNVDASAVVRSGGPPSGAHSDIFHPELAGLWLTAAGLG